MELIKDFTSLGKGDAAIAGGKGASLGEMMGAGIPVPPGFVVLSGAFENFLEETDLNVEIAAILDTVKTNEMHTVEHASEKIQALILGAQMQDDVRSSILQNYKTLDTKRVAVRSSATAEDSASAAWAGQLDSYLNTEESDILQNVQRCWASLFTPRAIFYRFEKGLHQTKISVAVVVQKMVASECAGIAFSVHPVTEDHNQLIIEAGFGLGDRIVSGEITPDSYVVSKNPKKILDININQSSQVLNEAQILELSDLIVKIENHYGFPCDIEWAYESGVFYIVQSRPITTLSKIDDSASEAIPGEWKGAFMLGNQDVDTSFLTLEMTWAGMFDPLIKEQIGVPVPDTYEEVLKGSTINTYVLAAPIKSFVEQAAKALKAKPELLIDLKKNTVTTAFAIREFAGLHLKELDSYDSKKLAELLLEIKKLQSACVSYGTVVAWADITGIISQNLSDVIDRRKVLKYPRHWYSHVLGSPEVPSLTEQAVAEIKTSTDPLPLPLLDKYYWLNQGYVGAGLTEAQLQTVRSHTAKKEEDKILVSAEELRAELQLTPEEWRHFEVSRDIIYMKSLRADSRQYLHVVTNRIVQRLGLLWDVDPVLITAMYAEEISDIANGTPLPTNLPERLAHSVLIPNTTGRYKVLIGQDAAQFVGQTLQRESIADADTIQGQIAYQGVVQGKVKLVFGPQHNDKVKKGDILVSTATSPQLLPAMIRAEAFITDVGGITSHAAIVARELKKPCLVGTKYATQVLKDGDLVEVDAEKGVIRILERHG